MTRSLPSARPACLAAFAAAGALAPLSAAAAEWETGVSGYYHLGVSAADIDGASGEGFGVFRDGEIHVNGRLTADNGLVFRARVEVEAQTTGDQIDENWASVSGPFGTILIGGADTALNEHGGVGVVKPTGDFFNYYDNDGGFLPGDPGGFIGEDDALGVRWFYRVAGFEIGASYQPDEDADGGQDSNSPVFEGADDQFAFGASYEAEFDDFAFAVGGGYLTNDDQQQYHVGAEVGFAGFTLAGFYNRDDPDGATTSDLERFGVGAMYAAGPWRFGGGYVRSDFQNGGGEEDFVHVGGGYNLAPGVVMNAAFEYGEDQAGLEGVAGLLWMHLRF